MLLTFLGRKTIPAVGVLLLLACSNQKSSEVKSSENMNKKASSDNSDDQHYEGEWDTVAYETLRASLPPFDLNQDLSTKSLEELRILRNTIPARYGYLFMNADLRYYFNNTSWYAKLMEARWYGDCEYSGLKKAPPIAYSAEESAFLEKVRKLEQERQKQNFIIRNGERFANVKNIVNQWQYGNLQGPLLTALDKFGYAMVPNNNIQFFHLYEQNDYSQMQNFVTTDIYLQLFHMHFSFLLRGLEEEQFIPVLKEMLSSFQQQANELARGNADLQVKDAARYTSAFYSIPARILETESVTVPEPYQQQAEQEIENIENQRAAQSALLMAYKDYYFQYDMFKPRGHYTRTDALKQYFKAMQWLQLAPYCLEDNKDLSRAIIAAYLLNKGKSLTGKPLLDLYRAILEPTSFLIGSPDNVSLFDLCDIVRQHPVSDPAELLTADKLAVLRVALQKVAQTKNVIKPKIAVTCPDKINFIPSRFVLDNEILQEMTEIDKRPYPKGLDVMAAFGSTAAEDVLINHHQEEKGWSEFLPQLNKMKTKYKNYEDWDGTVYAKWIKSLTAMLEKQENYPHFMQLKSWNKKNLNTALASWAELKHDAILYTEQPMGAECGNGGECAPPPEPYTIGYVEPNVKYWKEALELLDITEKLLAKNNLLSDQLKGRQEQLRELCTFLLDVSEKEIKGERISEQEYRTIELIGTNVESITRSIVGVYSWDHVSGPDKEVAIVADVYTNNQGDKAGILHAAVGYVNDLYVVVEIEGYLYLTKGATFSYYEFPRPLDDRMTDEQWQESLKNKTIYPVPTWIQDVIIKLDKSIEPRAPEYMYSSGC